MDTLERGNKSPRYHKPPSFLSPHRICEPHPTQAWIEDKFGEAAGITASRWRDQGEGSGGDGLDGFSDELPELSDASCMANNGGLALSSGARAAQSLEKARADREKREVERLLLEVFSSLPEPDSIYGVPSPTSDLSAQATVYAHEGGWQNTLPAYDTLSQHLSAAMAGGGAGGVVSTFLPDGGAGGNGAGGIGLQNGIAYSLQVWESFGGVIFFCICGMFCVELLGTLPLFFVLSPHHVYFILDGSRLRQVSPPTS